eukprot:comp12715_c0_seq1/m.7814 comp12715_c0_seq1/g.7814  ORF comp12715_c0_seq1/g.7814 comp12715_c0_seq1/m.7814 type:complete len:669 (-) comp12715_c0_seq1:568-2574(-)
MALPVEAEAASRPFHPSLTLSPVPQRKKLVESSIGNYVLGRTLGKGVFSVVREATHIITGQAVAVKIVDRNKVKEKDLKTLVREMQVLKLLSHPHVVRLYEIIDTEAAFYLVQELVTGDTLQAFMLDHGAMTEDLARKIFRQVFAGVQYCHSKRVVHRDLKPNNIMLDQDQNVKLIDFGLSRQFGANMLETHCGTPIFAAPELFNPAPYYGPAVDVWAVGVALYATVFGRLPFFGKGYRERIVDGDYTVPKGCSKEFQSIIQKMLEVDPDNRISAEALLSHPWTNIGYKVRPTPTSNEGTVDQQVLNVMKQLGFEDEEVGAALGQDKYNHVTATYHLLLAQKEHGCNIDVQLLMYPPPPPALAPRKTSGENGVTAFSPTSQSRGPSRSPSTGATAQFSPTKIISNATTLRRPSYETGPSPVGPPRLPPSTDRRGSLLGNSDHRRRSDSPTGEMFIPNTRGKTPRAVDSNSGSLAAHVTARLASPSPARRSTSPQINGLEVPDNMVVLQTGAISAQSSPRGSIVGIGQENSSGSEKEHLGSGLLMALKSPFRSRKPNNLVIGPNQGGSASAPTSPAPVPRSGGSRRQSRFLLWEGTTPDDGPLFASPPSSRSQSRSNSIVGEAIVINASPGCGVGMEGTKAGSMSPLSVAASSVRKFLRSASYEATLLD